MSMSFGDGTPGDEAEKRSLRKLGNLLTITSDYQDGSNPAALLNCQDVRYNQRVLIKTELPEMKKEDVNITLQNGVITIAGERRHVKEDQDESSLRVESFYGTFSRSFVLPDGIDSSAIRAESKDGILSVHIPKIPAVMPKTIDIKVQ